MENSNKIDRNCSSQAGHFVDNSKHVLQNLSMLYSNCDQTDIQLKVGHRVFNSHKLVLSMSSDVFKTMLTNPTWPEAHKQRVVLKEEPNCEAVFEDFLRYFYTGTITLTEQKVLSVLSLSDKYNIGHLSDKCMDYMCKRCLPSATKHIITWLQYAHVCVHKRLEEACRKFIILNFDMIMRSESFPTMNVNVLKSFLRSSELVIEDEYSLYMGIKSWVLNQPEQSTAMEHHHLSLSELFFKVMPYIRFPMMQMSQIYLLENDTLLMQFKDFFLEKLFRAVGFHTTCASRRPSLRRHTRETTQFQPRNYTNESWSTAIIVENFYSMLPGQNRGAFFSTPSSLSNADHNGGWDWHLTLYPKGVNFKKFVMIGIDGNREVEEQNFRTVRLAVSVNCTEKRCVEIGVLIIGSQDGLEFVQKGFSKYAVFDSERTLFNINDIVDYDVLHGVTGQEEHCPYLIGQNGNIFKIRITVRPVDM